MPCNGVCFVRSGVSSSDYPRNDATIPVSDIQQDSIGTTPGATVEMTLEESSVKGASIDDITFVKCVTGSTQNDLLPSLDNFLSPQRGGM